MGFFLPDIGNDKWFIDLIHSPSIFQNIEQQMRTMHYVSTYLLFGFASKYVRCSYSFVSKWSCPPSFRPSSSNSGMAIWQVFLPCEKCELRGQQPFLSMPMYSSESSWPNCMLIDHIRIHEKWMSPLFQHNLKSSNLPSYYTILSEPIICLLASDDAQKILDVKVE